jgi:hypothetical protein
MPDNTITVSSLLGLPDGNGRQDTVKLGLQPEDLDSIKAAVHSAKGWSWAGIEKEFFAGFSSLLNVDLLGLIAAAWEKYDVLAEYGKNKSPEQVASVELLEHTMSIELHPYLEIYFAEIPQPKTIECALTLNLTLKGLKLNIENGVIKSVGSGSCEGEAEIEIEKIPLPKRPSFGPFDLPGKVGLGKGITIN